MLTFFLIPDTKQFLKLADKSHGEVLLHLPNGTKHNLKCNENAQQVLDTAKSNDAGVEISLTDHRDVKPFIQYMVEAAL